MYKGGNRGQKQKGQGIQSTYVLGWQQKITAHRVSLRGSNTGGNNISWVIDAWVDYR